MFFLPCARTNGWLGAALKPAPAGFAGSLSVPDWPDARGLSASDLRWRTYQDVAPWILDAGVEIGADGLLGRKLVGNGLAIFCQVDPDGFAADEKTYFRYTRWRATRAVAQLLANLGASFPADSQVFHPIAPVGKLGWSVGPNGDRSGPQATGPPDGPELSPVAEATDSQLRGLYHPDYRTDFPMGDNPYRYYRW